MSYFNGICEHLVSYLARKGKTLPDKFFAWREDGKLSLNGNTEGDGVIVAMFRYQMVMEIERVPTKSVSASVLMARLVAWLADFDEHRGKHNLSGPAIDIDDFTGTGEASMAFRVPMIEPITLVPAPDGEAGDIEYCGRQWNIGEPVVWVAEEGELVHVKAEPH